MTIERRLHGNGRVPRMSSVGIESLRPGYRYVVVRPNGRTSRRSFGHPFRAAEHAMAAYRVDTWAALHRLGFTVQHV